MWLLGIQYIYYNIEENDELYESYILKLSKINIRNLCRMNFNLTGLNNWNIKSGCKVKQVKFCLRLNVSGRYQLFWRFKRI